MDAQSMQQATREVVKKKFGKKRLIMSKVVPRYPQSVEREYERVTTSYMKLLSSTVAEYIPLIRDALSMQVKGRQDAANSDPKQSNLERAVVSATIDEIFDELTNDFMKRQGLYGLSARIEKLSNLNRKLTIAEWKRVVKRTLGINLMDDYYKGEKFQRLFDEWIADNVGLITTIPPETLGSMRNIVKNGYLSGASNKTIAKQIQDAYDIDKNRAQFYARDQTAKLNAQITQEQQRDAGVDEYVWRTAGNISTFPNSGRVRETHALLNNKRFKYSDPPVVDDRTGRRANPGEDYQCRCVALPVFDIDTVVLPWEKGGVM